MTDPAATGAAVLYGAAVVVLLGLRSWQQRRATGSAGFNGFRGMARGGADRVAGTCFVVAVLAGVLSPVAAATGALPLVRTQAGPVDAVGWAGVALTGGGLVLGVAAQQAMGKSWRIGVDPAERTDLVTTGPFRLVRNPIFTALLAIQAGTTMLAPTWVAILGVAVLALGAQLQTRLVEEPYLRRTHGAPYRHYAARTGRFLPALGRLPEPQTQQRPVQTRGGTR